MTCWQEQRRATILLTARKVVVSVLTSALCATSAAEDIEIYTGQAGFLGKPNILFIIDNSGSMDSEVTITRPYSALTSYDNSPQNCPPERIYWAPGNNPSPPDCDSNHWFAQSQFRCISARHSLNLDNDNPDAPGVYRDSLTRAVVDKAGKHWWTKLSEEVQSPDHVECKRDQPEPHTGNDRNYHGDYAGSDSMYISQSEGSHYDDAYRWGSNTWDTHSGEYTLFSAHYLRWYHNEDSTVTTTRLQVVKDALTATIDAVTGVEAGLMEFNRNDPSDGSHGGSLLFPITDLGDPDAAEPNPRSNIKDAVTGMDANGNTPLAETLWEAFLYWTGGEIKYGDYSSEIAGGT